MVETEALGAREGDERVAAVEEGSLNGADAARGADVLHALEQLEIPEHASVEAAGHQVAAHRMRTYARDRLAVRLECCHSCP